MAWKRWYRLGAFLGVPVVGPPHWLIILNLVKNVLKEKREYQTRKLR